MPHPSTTRLEHTVPDRPEIVCLCGSARFANEVRAVEWELALAGVIVLAPHIPAAGEGGDTFTEEQRATLGRLHLHRVDLADRVLVVNPGGYVGEATRREIAHAEASGTPVGFTDPS